MYDPNYAYLGGHGYPQKPVPLKVHPAAPLPVEAYPYPDAKLPAAHYGLLGHQPQLYQEYLTPRPYAGSGNHLPFIQSQTDSKIEARLENEDLWNRFHEIGTEMIVSKTGRRMFPFLNISIRNLDPSTMYAVFLHMVPADGYRYKYTKSEWVKAGKADPHLGHVYYVHPDSPQKGSKWMNRVLSFQRAKLTNNTLDQNGHIILNSMHKYNPRIIVTSICETPGRNWPRFRDFIFPKTSFIAVTAYQNASITQLKIDNNPFAKGFRETGQGRNKKKIAREDVAVLGVDQNDINIRSAVQVPNEIDNEALMDVSDQGYRSSSSMSSESTISAPISLAEISEISDEEIDVGKPPTPPTHSHLRLFRAWLTDDDTKKRQNPSGKEHTVTHKPEEETSANEKPKELSLPAPLRDNVTLHPTPVQDMVIPSVSDRSSRYLSSPGAVPYPYYLYSNSPSASSGNSYAYPPYVGPNSTPIPTLPGSPIHPFPFSFPVNPPK
ncbi:T-box transcription factor TBX20-like [Palaemon carinicauda]|uniref:T-box transcription factor TBX20-like n=1 Tax=Palaemon carinicauda TaxID=392227 RepID=UPI0035B612C1